MESSVLVLGAIAAVVIGAGLVSIFGALRRTAARPAHNGRLSGDGGPIYGHTTHDRSQDHDGDALDSGDGGGDGGGGGD